MNRYLFAALFAVLMAACVEQPSTEADLEIEIDQAVSKCGFEAIGLRASGAKTVVIEKPSHFLPLEVEEGVRLRCVLEELEHFKGLLVDFNGVTPLDEFLPALPEEER